MCAFPQPHVATAELGGRSTLMLRAYPLFGHHNDWSRSYVISDGESSVTIEAFEDTGWWRGSALFKDATGAYFIDDGFDFFFFSVCPLKVLKQLPIEPLPDCDGAESIKGVPSPRTFPSSKLTYTGTFFERPDIAFQPWNTYPEPSRDDLDAGG